ncbi:MAG: GAF domain-containing protein [Deltaproteobacteria bacterium]|nr:GAF domain-containing protein [Deltaproteobacteria bacterium]MBW2072062.1 GAF domain-containing protein [Deltaproteobacteria bacterium]
MTSRERFYFQSFAEVAKAVNSTLDLREVLNLLVEEVARIMELKACAIRLLDSKKRTLELVASHGLSENYRNKGPVDADQSIKDAMEGKTISIYNAIEDPRAPYKEQVQQEGISSIVSVPLRIKGRVIGVMRLYTERPREFAEDEIQFVEALAEMGAVAIENARMYEGIKQDYERLLSFREVAKAVNSTLELQKVLDLLVDNMIRTLNLKACAIRLLHGKRRTLELVASRGLSENYINKGPVNADKSIAESVEGKTVAIINAQEDPRIQYQQEAKVEGITSLLSVPLTIKGNVIGVVRCYTEQPREFSESETHSAEVLAEIGAIAIENAKMHQRIKQDYESVMSDIYDFVGYRRSI